MVVNAVREPNSLEICYHILEVLCFSVAFVIRIYSFQHTTDAQVVATVLVEEDVASCQRGFAEVVNQRLLFQVKLLKSVNFVTEHLNVCKLFVCVIKLTLCNFRSVAGC